MTKHCIDSGGNWLGGFDVLPNGATEVSSAPEDARQKWLFPNWGTIPADSQEKQDTDFIQKNLMQMAENLSNLGEALVAQGSLNPSLMPTRDRQLFIKMRDIVARYKARQQVNIMQDDTKIELAVLLEKHRTLIKYIEKNIERRIGRLELAFITIGVAAVATITKVLFATGGL